MYRIQLNDGTEYEIDAVGTVRDRLGITGLTLTIAEAATVFSDAEKTGHMSYYQEDKLTEVYEGYTKLENVTLDWGTVSITLRKE